jgi:2-polyprenyl-3-methyl-5-hydroxy-6-metoxy-1,4-benzoquinol methylase
VAVVGVDQRMRMLDAFLSNVEITPKRCLDVGCSRGYFSKAIAEKYGAEAIGYDIYHDPQSVIDVVDSKDKITGKFDLVTAIHVLEHFPEPIKELEWMVSLLNKDGVLMLELPFKRNSVCPHPVIFSRQSIPMLMKHIDAKYIYWDIQYNDIGVVLAQPGKDKQVVMTNEDLRQQYNDIYKEKPDKWTSDDRDNDAWFMLNRVLLAQPPEYLLDIGCGNGHTIKYFKDRWPKTEYTGIDVSDEAIAIAANLLPGECFGCGEIEEVKLLGENYDVITCMGVAEHLPDIQRWLKPKGVLYLEVPNNLSYSDDQSEGFRASLGGNQEEWHLRKETWDKIIADAGYVGYVTRTRSNPFPVFIWILQKSQLLENSGE